MTRPAARLAVLSGLALAGAHAGAHDEDWRKLADVTPPVLGPIWTYHDPAPRDGGLPASGVTCLAVLPLNTFGLGSAKGNDCWGYTSPTGREYAIYGQEKGFGIVEITDPGNPVIIASIPGPKSLWHDVKVSGHYAYGVSEGGEGAQVIDLSEVDNGVATLVHNWRDGNSWNSAHNIIVNPDNGNIFTAGSNVGNGGIVHLDLTDPERPAVNGGWTDMYVHDACIVTMQSGPYAGREIAFAASGLGGGWNLTGLRIVDLTDRHNPQVISSAFWSSAGYSHQAWLSDDRRYLFVGDEYDEIQRGVPTRTLVFDVSDLDNPFLADTFTNGLPSIDHNQYCVDGYLFQSNYTSGLRIFDVSDPLNAQEIAWIDTFPSTDLRAFNGTWSNYPFFPSGNVIISDMARGLIVVRPDAVVYERLRLLLPDAPDMVNASGGDVVTLRIDEMNVSVDPATVEMIFDGGAGPVSVPGVPGASAGEWDFTLPPAACSGTAVYSFRAETTAGKAYTLPLDAPATLITAQVSDDCGCPADLDGNGMLNVDDVDAFASAFLSGDLAAADCDANALLNVDDVTCFVESFAAGCP